MMRPSCRRLTVGLVLTAFLAPAAAIAQYPGSAGSFDNGNLSSFSSANSGSDTSASSAPTEGSNAGSSGNTADLSTNEPKTDAKSMTGNDYGADEADRNYGWKPDSGTAVQSRKATRQQALVRQFRLEFAKTMIIETANQLPLQVLQADRYLTQFSDELDSGLSGSANLKSLGKDLAMVRDAIDGRLDKVIASYRDYRAPRRSIFSKTPSVAADVQSLRTELRKLRLKNDLLQFTEFSLQSMGYYVR